MLRIFNKKRETVDDIIRNNECNALLGMIKQQYSSDMTSIIVIVEQNKQSFWHCAGLEPAQAILSLDQLHHRVQHEGLPEYD